MAIISSYMSGGEYQPRQGEQPSDERVQQALQTLEQGIDSILSSEGITTYLRPLSRFHAYSFGNVLLIAMQRPDATRVAGYRKWQELGRQVKKGEQGIKILVPYKRKPRLERENEEDEDELEVVRGFGVGTVFDITQTEGEPLPEPPKPEVIEGASEVGMRLFVDLLDLTHERGVIFSRQDTKPAHGFYDPVRQHIALDVDVSGDQATKTLLHETAHHLAGHVLGMAAPDIETVAEASAFVILNHYGIDASDYSFPYVAGWSKDRSVLKRNLGAIQQTTHTIIGSIEGTLPEEPEHRSHGDSFRPAKPVE